MCDTVSNLRLLEVSQAGASSLADAVAAVTAADDVNVSRYVYDREVTSYYGI